MAIQDFQVLQEKVSTLNTDMLYIMIVKILKNII